MSRAGRACCPTFTGAAHEIFVELAGNCVQPCPVFRYRLKDNGIAVSADADGLGSEAEIFGSRTACEVIEVLLLN